MLGALERFERHLLTCWGVQPTRGRADRRRAWKVWSGEPRKDSTKSLPSNYVPALTVRKFFRRKTFRCQTPNRGACPTARSLNRNGRSCGSSRTIQSNRPEAPNAMERTACSLLVGSGFSCPWGTRRIPLVRCTPDAPNRGRLCRTTYGGQRRLRRKT